MTHQTQIDALIEAGEKATADSEWFYAPAPSDRYMTTIYGYLRGGIEFGIGSTVCGGAVQQNDDAEFICLAANAREAIKAMRDEVLSLRTQAMQDFNQVQGLFAERKALQRQLDDARKVIEEYADGDDGVPCQRDNCHKRARQWLNENGGG